MKPSLLLLATMLAGWLNRRQQAVIEYLQEENRVLREHCERSGRLRLTNAQRARLARKGKALGWASLREAATLATPQTILLWHRELVARKYDGSKQVRQRSSARRMEVRETVERIASENATWGYRRIQGALRAVGLTTSYTTVRRILLKGGFDPSPKRTGDSNWGQFIRSHLDVLGAMDFFSVEVWTLRGLVRYSVHFIIHPGTRRVEITRIAPDWDEHQMLQIARRVTDCVDGFLRGMQFVIMDKDPLFTKRFRELFRSSGIRPVPLPPQSPNLNAYAERFVLSIKSECLDHFVFVGEKSLRRAITQYLEHYHRERPHQGLGNRAIEKGPESFDLKAPIQVHERLGGLLKYYHREAA